MSRDETLTLGLGRVPVRTLRVEVTEGVDLGRAHRATGEAITVGTATAADLVLTDPTVSRFHVELSRAKDGVLVVDHGSRNGTFVGATRVERAVVAVGAAVRVGRTTLRATEGDDATVDLHPAESLGGLRGRAPVMRRLMAAIERAARSDAAVLVVGESGTGKELVARALHDLGPRKERPFVTVDCGSLSPTLVASELFGHERGAFTGADRQHVGSFERASGGTVFLDEIGELPASLQAALLGVLERRRFRRLGGQREIEVDVRVVSATNRDLRAEVNLGTFRLDLYYRLAVVVLKIPPLREHPEDVPLLVEHFLRDSGYDDDLDALISPPVLADLQTHRWPGNVRELRNLVEATVAMGEPPRLDGEPGRSPDSSGPVDTIGAVLELTYKDARAQVLDRFESTYLARLLERSAGNVSAAARIARMDRSHLIERLKHHGLK